MTNINNITSRNDINDRFEDEDLIRSFLGEVGFKNIEIHHFIETKDELKSFEMLNIDKDSCDELLASAVVAVIKI